MTEPVSVARMAELTLVLAERAFAAESANGGGQPTGEVRWTLGRLAVAAPGMALRLPHVRASLDPVTLATVRALVTPLSATPQPERPPEQPESALSTAQAAAMLGYTPQAVRAAAKRGTLPGRIGPDGRWRFKRSDVTEYRRTHAKRP